MRIQEMATSSGLTTYSLRFYERKGLITPSRNSHGEREYTSIDQAAIHRITLYRRAGLSVEQIKHIFTGMKTEDMIKLLTATRDNVIAQKSELQNTIDFLSEKIEHENSRLAGGGHHIPTPSEDIDDDGLAD